MARTRGFAVRLTILLGVVLGTFVAGPSASAGGPATQFLGFVLADGNGNIPVRVRALGDGGVVCGTADVLPSGDETGFYDITVTPAAERTGCPYEGDTVNLVLLYGPVDDGTPAITTTPALFEAGASTVVHLVPEATLAPASVGGWNGALPPAGGIALLTWAGPENTPAEQAVQTLGIPVVGIWHLPSGTQRFVSYIPGAPAFAQTYRTVHTGEIVFVRAR